MSDDKELSPSGICGTTDTYEEYKFDVIPEFAIISASDIKETSAIT
tara:strand:- start:46 stop:183 length:138 start_codon:yes stop_codon:yes gene_type:complete